MIFVMINKLRINILKLGCDHFSMNKLVDGY